MTILRHYSLQAAAGREAELGDALAGLSAKVSACPGCEKVELLVDVRDPGHYIFIESWSGTAERDAAGAALGKSAFAPVLNALASPPVGSDLVPAG